MTSYQRPISTFWWLHRRSYFVFVLRELSSVFIAWFVVYLLLLVHAISSGSAAYASFLAWSSGGWVLVLNVVALLFVLLHAVTWFNLAPRAMVVRHVAPGVVLALHYLLWVLLSTAVAWVVLR